jgi:transcriptional regulator with XRE-family HTH domain
MARRRKPPTSKKRNPSDFAMAFRAIRLAHGVSQQDIAEALGVNPRMISGFERGWRQTISEAHFDIIQRVLGATAEEMLELRRARLTTILELTFAQDLPANTVRRLKAILRTARLPAR